MNNRFVVFACESDYYNVIFADIKQMNNAEYFGEVVQTKSAFIRFLVKVLYADKVRPVIPEFIHRFIYKKFYDAKNTDDVIYFIFLGCRLRYCSDAYIKYIRKKYPNCRTVLFFTDIVSKNSAFNYQKVKSNFDLVLTYDKHDAAKYGFFYHPTVYAKPEDKRKISTKQMDVFFCGMAKERFEILYNLAELMKKEHLKFMFYVPDAKIYNDSIIKKSLTYYENVEMLSKSNCILEVQQSGATGYTLRTWEAISYNKKLLTNNHEIIHAPFYDPRYIQVFDDINNIDFSWVIKEEDVNYDNVDLSSAKLFEDIEGYFRENVNEFDEKISNAANNG